MSTEPTTTEAPFSEAELRAARAQMQMRALTEAARGMAEALQESLRVGFAEFEASRQRAAEAAAERQKRVDAAEEWLREQEGAGR